MKYEDMSLTQLKSLTRDRGLGTGRSKQELIDKLVTYDSRSAKVDDGDLTENQINKMMEEGETVVIKTPKIKSETPSESQSSGTTTYRVKFYHVGALLESEHNFFKRRAWELAKEDGFYPVRDDQGVRFVATEKGKLIYELDVSE